MPSGITTEEVVAGGVGACSVALKGSLFSAGGLIPQP